MIAISRDSPPPLLHWVFRVFILIYFEKKQVEVLEYPELGMEAVWKIDVENFPAFIVVDGKGDRAHLQYPVVFYHSARSLP